MWGFIFAPTFKHVNAEELEVGPAHKVSMWFQRRDFSGYTKTNGEYGSVGLIQVLDPNDTAKSGL